MKETLKLLFVPIIGSVRSVTNDVGSFQGRHDFATLALWDTGVEWSYFTADLFGVVMEPGTRQRVIIAFQCLTSSSIC